jgi:hypothetical protein
VIFHKGADVVVTGCYLKKAEQAERHESSVP